MRERKYVKFKTNMYEDTKFKIIDMKPERDVIHYVWSRLIVLAGKVNREGELFLSKSIPYTIDTLAIEFNRNVEQIKLALENFIELEMVELTEDKIYIVRNFVKHQNIKVKEKEEGKSEKADKTDIKNIGQVLNEKVEATVNSPEYKESDEKINDNSLEEDGKNSVVGSEAKDKEPIKLNEKRADKKSKAQMNETLPLISKNTKSTRKRKKKKDDIDYDSVVCTDGVPEDTEETGFVDVDENATSDAKIFKQWTFV